MGEVTEGEYFIFDTFKFMATCKACEKEYDLLEEKKKDYYYKVIE